jgi:beta-phosphoglucomutase
MEQFAVIFDMDGTLIDNTPYHFKSWQAFFKNHQLGEISEHTYRSQMSGTPIFDTLRRIFGADTDADTLRKLRDEKEQFYRELYAPYMAPIAGLEAFLAELKNAGIKMAMASSATVADIDFILNGLPIRNYFEVIIDGSQVVNGKPNPDIFLKAAAALDTSPHRCVVFEDSVAGIAAANAAGTKVVGITTGNKAAALQPANLIIDDYTGLTVQTLSALF